MLVTLGTLRPSVSRPESPSPASGLLQRADGSRVSPVLSINSPCDCPCGLACPLAQGGTEGTQHWVVRIPRWGGPALLVVQTSTSSQR